MTSPHAKAKLDLERVRHGELGRDCVVADVQKLIEVQFDGRTVWVNSAEGNLGRFSKYGMDVHTKISDQMNGAPQCLACTHELPDLAVWYRFQDLMLEHYAVDVPDYAMPEFLQ